MGSLLGGTQIFRVSCHKLFARVLVKHNITTYYYSIELTAELVAFSGSSC